MEDFSVFDVDELTEMLADYKACFKAIAVAHQSYSIANRTFNRADQKEVRQTIYLIRRALAFKSGGIVRTTYADMSCP